jgi:predicted RNA binding protein YcfA (HicA-like mRNA interferase family)
VVGARLPAISGKRTIQTLKRLGFVVDRVVGSHHVLIHPHDHRRAVTVPVHGSRSLKPGTLRSILRQAGVTVEEFTRLI